MWFIPYLESTGDTQLFTKVRQRAHICTAAVYLTPSLAFLLRKGARAYSTSLLPPEHTHQFSSWLYNTQLGQSDFTENKTRRDNNRNPAATNSLAPQEQGTLRMPPPLRHFVLPSASQPLQRCPRCRGRLSLVRAPLPPSSQSGRGWRENCSLIASPGGGRPPLQLRVRAVVIGTSEGLRS